MKFCPQCHLLLIPKDCDGIPILVCQGCGGCWFTCIALDEAISAHPGALAELDTRFPGEPRFENYAGLSTYCPECRTTALTQDEISSDLLVPALKCARCQGVWLRSGTRRALINSLSLAEELPTEEISTAEGSDSLRTEANEPRTSLSEECDRPAEKLNGTSSTGDVVVCETLRDYLSANEQYAANFIHGHLPRIPARKLAIVTCMDARMQVYEILGLKPGDANVIRNAGGIVTEDVLRSLIVSHHLLGTREFLIINHTDCGLLVIEEEEFRDMLTNQTGAAAIIPSVFHAFKDIEKNVRTQVQKVRSHPWIPKEISVRGFVYDVRTGRLSEVEQRPASMPAPLDLELEKENPIVV